MPAKNQRKPLGVGKQLFVPYSRSRLRPSRHRRRTGRRGRPAAKRRRCGDRAGPANLNGVGRNGRRLRSRLAWVRGTRRTGRRRSPRGLGTLLRRSLRWRRRLGCGRRRSFARRRGRHRGGTFRGPWQLCPDGRHAIQSILKRHRIMRCTGRRRRIFCVVQGLVHESRAHLLQSEPHVGIHGGCDPLAQRCHGVLLFPSPASAGCRVLINL